MEQEVAGSCPARRPKKTAKWPGPRPLFCLYVRAISANPLKSVPFCPPKCVFIGRGANSPGRRPRTRRRRGDHPPRHSPWAGCASGRAAIAQAASVGTAPGRPRAANAPPPSPARPGDGEHRPRPQRRGLHQPKRLEATRTSDPRVPPIESGSSDESGSSPAPPRRPRPRANPFLSPSTGTGVRP